MKQNSILWSQSCSEGEGLSEAAGLYHQGSGVEGQTITELKLRRCFTSSGRYVGVALTASGSHHHRGVGVLLEVIGSYHHGGGAQGVAGASEVVPLDPVELPDVVADRVVNTVQVGETTGVKPPTWRETKTRRETSRVRRRRKKKVWLHSFHCWTWGNAVDVIILIQTLTLPLLFSLPTVFFNSLSVHFFSSPSVSRLSVLLWF